MGDEHAGVVTVADILKVDMVARCRLIAGSGGIMRPVRSVTVMEVPDVYPWVSEGEMVLTTLFAIKDDPEALANLVPNLWERGISAIAIKPRRYVQEIPAVMVEQSERLGFPLIEIPETISHSVLLEGILQYLLGHSRPGTRDVSRYQKVLDSVVDGLDLGDVVSLLVSVVQNPIAVFGAGGDPIFSGFPDGFPGDQAVRSLGSVRWEPCPYAALSSGQLARVKSGEIRMRGRPVGIHQFVSGVGSASPYRLVVWEWARVLSGDELVMLNQISTLIFFELDKAHALRQVERRYQMQFWQNWMAGEIGTVRSVQQQGWQIGCQIENVPRRVIVFRSAAPPDGGLDLGPGATRDAEDPVSRLGRRIGEWLRRERVDALWFPLEEAVVVTVPAGPAAEAVDGWVRRLIRDIDREKGGLVAGIGRPYAINEQHVSYREAMQAARLASAAGHPEPTASYETLGVYRLLGALQGSPELDGFVADYLGPLKEYDRQYHANLLETVRHYLDQGCSVRRASQKMFVHYNTVVYRLNLVESVSGRSLDDPAFRLALYVALKAQAMG